MNERRYGRGDNVDRRIAEFASLRHTMPDLPQTSLSTLAQRALDHLGLVREDLISCGIDPNQKPFDPLSGALYNRELVVDQIAPGLSRFFDRTSVGIEFASFRTVLLSYLDLVGPIINFNGQHQQLEYNCGELSSTKIQGLWELRTNRRVVADFGNLTPDRLISKFARKIGKYTR